MGGGHGEGHGRHTGLQRRVPEGGHQHPLEKYPSPRVPLSLSSAAFTVCSTPKVRSLCAPRRPVEAGWGTERRREPVPGLSAGGCLIERHVNHASCRPARGRPGDGVFSELLLEEFGPAGEDERVGLDRSAPIMHGGQGGAPGTFRRRLLGLAIIVIRIAVHHVHGLHCPAAGTATDALGPMAAAAGDGGGQLDARCGWVSAG